MKDSWLIEQHFVYELTPVAFWDTQKAPLWQKVVFPYESLFARNCQ